MIDRAETRAPGDVSGITTLPRSCVLHHEELAIAFAQQPLVVLQTSVFWFWNTLFEHSKTMSFSMLFGLHVADVVERILEGAVAAGRRVAVDVHDANEFAVGAGERIAADFRVSAGEPRSRYA